MPTIAARSRATLFFLAAPFALGAALSPTPDWSGNAALAVRLWREFTPYLAAAARDCLDTGRPLWRRVGDVWPEIVPAAEYPNEYLVGPDLLVVAALPPPSPLSGLVDVRLWIPPGRWRNWYTGLALEGPAEALVPVPPGEEALFVRDGAIIAISPRAARSAGAHVETTVLHCLRGDRGSTHLIRESPSTAVGGAPFEWTRVRQYSGDGVRRIVIGPTLGPGPRSQLERHYEVRLPDEWPALEVLVDGRTLAPAAAPGRLGWWYDAATFTTVVRVAQRDLRDEIAIDILPADEGMPDAGLSQGLRGFYRIIQGADAEMGARSPPGLEALLRLRALLASDPNVGVSFDRALPHYWYEALRELAQSEMPAAERNRWAMRLLGMSITTAARPGKMPGTFEIAIRIASSAPFADVSELTGRVTCVSAAAPTVEAFAAREFGGLAAASPMLLTFARPAGLDDPAPRFRADVELTLREFSISLPLEFGF